MNENSNQVSVSDTNTTGQTQVPGNKKPNTRKDGRWDAISKLIESGTAVEALVGDSACNREGRPCGLNVTINGLTGFLPGSELPRGYNACELKGQKLSVKVLEANRNRRRLLVSRNAVLADEKRAFVASLQVEAPVQGTVVSVVEFGYFVNIGAVDALLHISQTPLLNGKPQTFAVGDSVEARVKSVDSEKGKVGITMRKPRLARPDTGSHGTTDRSAAFTEKFNRKPFTMPAPRTTAPAKPRAAKAPVRTGSRSKFSLQFESFQDLAAWWQQNSTAQPADATAQS